MPANGSDERRPLLRELAVGIVGRHDLYVACLAEVLRSRGVEVEVLDRSGHGRTVFERLDVLVVESPISSELALYSEADVRLIALVEQADGFETGPDEIEIDAVLSKNASLGELSLAIRTAAARPADPLRGLTARQREVLRLVVEGLDNAAIARRLRISTRTARAHVSGMLERLGVENRTQAAVVAVRSGLDSAAPSRWP